MKLIDKVKLLKQRSKQTLVNQKKYWHISQSNLQKILSIFYSTTHLRITLGGLPMLVISIILTVLGLSLILVSLIVSKSDSLDLREKIYLPGLCLLLIGFLCLIGHFVNSSL